jgi:predicted RNA-binding protein
MTCWIGISEGKAPDIVREKRIWGVARRHADTISKVHLGDRILLCAQDMEAPSLFGVYEVISELFVNQTPIFGEAGEVYPLRLKLRPVTIFDRPIPLASVAGDLETFAGSTDWKADLQGTAMRAIPDADCTRLIAAAGRS